MAARIAEVFGHRGCRIGREELQRCRFRSGGGDHGGVFHRAGFFEFFHQLRHCRPLLPDGDIEAVQLHRRVGFVVAFLVQNGIERDCGLAGLTVADNQLALTTANRDHRVNRLEAGRHRLMHRFTRDDAGGLHVGHAAVFGYNRAFAIDRVAKAVNNAAQQRFAYRHVNDRLGALDRVAFLDVAVRAEDHDADVIDFKVQRHAPDTAGKLDHFARLDVVEPVHARDPVADAQHAANFGHLGVLPEVLDLLFQNRRDLSCLDSHYPTSFMACWREASLEATEVSIIFEPSFTIIPPMRLSSTATFNLTVLPLCLDNVAASFLACASLNACAAVISAVISPLASAMRARSAANKCGSTNRRRLSAKSAKVLVATVPRPIFAAIPSSALRCAARE